MEVPENVFQGVIQYLKQNDAVVLYEALGQLQQKDLRLKQEALEKIETKKKKAKESREAKKKKK